MRPSPCKRPSNSHVTLGAAPTHVTISDNSVEDELAVIDKTSADPTRWAVTTKEEVANKGLEAKATRGKHSKDWEGDSHKKGYCQGPGGGGQRRKKSKM